MFYNVKNMKRLFCCFIFSVRFSFNKQKNRYEFYTKINKWSTKIQKGCLV